MFGEQLLGLASKFRRQRANFRAGEQIQTPASNFWGWRASSSPSEQILARASKSRRQRANFSAGEQIQAPASKF